MKLPAEWEVNLTLLQERVEAQPPINFEDMLYFEPCEVLDYELYNYQRV